LSIFPKKIKWNICQECDYDYYIDYCNAKLILSIVVRDTTCWATENSD